MKISRNDPCPCGHNAERMIRAALDRAEVEPEDIDYVNSHGTGTRQNDEIESTIIERIFGSGPLVNSTKSLTGHTVGASGAIEAAVTALSIKENQGGLLEAWNDYFGQ